MAKPSISIVVPAFNEEGSLKASTESVRTALSLRCSSYEIILVNDASRDGTGAVAEALAREDPQVKVLHHSQNKGMGQSLLDGFRMASKEYVGSFPGDNALDGTAFTAMLEAVGRAEIVSYYVANPEFRSWTRRFISWLFVRILNALFGLHLRYYNGHAIYRREHIQNLTHLATGHGFLAETLIRLLKAGHSIIELPALQHGRNFGETKAFSLRNVMEISKTFFRLARELRRSH